jgi:prepilin-type N-terminal cleavage/methylation domain-containing protein
MRRQGGFTLLELAVVLVVVAFLMAAVMQGQKMLHNARVHKIVSDMDSYRQAFILYYDRYGMYPGDENDPGFPTGDTYNGNHNGLIDPAEAANVWEDLANALGIVRKTSPVRGGIYNFGSRSFFGTGSQNYISVTNLLNKMAQSIDATNDDGVYNTGNIQSGAAYDGSEALITLFWRI